MVQRRRRVAITTVSALCGFALAACSDAGTESQSDRSTTTSTLTDSTDSVSTESVSPDSVSPDSVSAADAGQVNPTLPDSGTGERTGAGGRSEAVAFAEAVDANLLVVRLDDDTVLTWHDGAVTESPTSGMEYIYSDGRFLYRWVGEGGGTLQASASTLDEVTICETDGRIHHVTKRVDGSYVAAVERDLKFEGDLDERPEFAHPLDAVDCQSGDRQPIEPVTYYGGDGQSRFIERIGGRVLTGYGDAEGNADVQNENGVSINGDDYAGYHTFNADASLVAYGDMGAGMGPHLSPVVVVRDTDSGRQLARKRFDLPFKSLHFVDDRLVVTFPEDAETLFNGGGFAVSAVVLDTNTGEKLDEVDVGLDVLYLS